jgi:adenine-specific DNA-methyltransferase
MQIKINKLNAELLLSVDSQSELSFNSEYSPLFEEVLPQEVTCNLFKGDNNLVLSKLSYSLKNSIDFCYIDPPYNTSSKFIYNDSRLSQNHIIWGTHAEWMTFMASRLVYLREILKETGVVAISIDDYEQPYLRVLLDRIFGEKNFIACLAVCRSRNGKGGKHGVATNHEYIVVYGKTSKATLPGKKEECDSSYNKEDKHGRYKVNGLFRKKGDASLKEDRPNMHYPLFYDENGNVYTENVTGELKSVYPLDSKGVERRWLWGKDKATKDSWMLTASKSGVVYVKNYHTSEKRVKPRSLWYDNRHLTERATNQIKEIYGEKIFETPKPTDLIEDLIDSHTNQEALIIDFFAGTGTTAHAAHNLNIRDGGSRKVILVEQQQPISPKHIAFKSGYKFISDITERRLQWLKEKNNSFTYNVIDFADKESIHTSNT